MATIASSASVCPKCGSKVETASDQLMKLLTEADKKAKMTDNGVSTLSVLGQIEAQEEEGGKA
jgi:hypothetical protein